MDSLVTVDALQLLLFAFIFIQSKAVYAETSCLGHYFTIEASCINNSFAMLYWEKTAEVYNRGIDLIIATLTCYNVTTSATIYSRTLFHQQSLSSSKLIEYKKVNLTNDVECQFSACGVDFYGICCSNDMAATCSFAIAGLNELNTSPLLAASPASQLSTDNVPFYSSNQIIQYSTHYNDLSVFFSSFTTETIDIGSPSNVVSTNDVSLSDSPFINVLIPKNTNSVSIIAVIVGLLVAFLIFIVSGLIIAIILHHHKIRQSRKLTNQDISIDIKQFQKDKRFINFIMDDISVNESIVTLEQAIISTDEEVETTLKPKVLVSLHQVFNPESDNSNFNNGILRTNCQKEFSPSKSLINMSSSDYIDSNFFKELASNGIRNCFDEGYIDSNASFNSSNTTGCDEMSMYSLEITADENIYHYSNSKSEDTDDGGYIQHYELEKIDPSELPYSDQDTCSIASINTCT